MEILKVKFGQQVGHNQLCVVRKYFIKNPEQWIILNNRKKKIILNHQYSYISYLEDCIL